ncbi:MAG: 2-amino-4-hydroxy-6-hydroxymethyldihydropteridine diphosphokinase [Bacteroidia bacterium]|nr:2-amino-4-hydroxy-6-hydroxymethyldihydropteridine diphosphokinase [Bacteroidia bacterium]
MVNTVYLSLGSNMGNMQAIVHSALSAIDIDEKCNIIKTSNLYKTQPWGITEQAHFLNVVCCISTTYTPVQLLNFINGIEHNFGRARTAYNKWQGRTLDIDILLFNNEVIHSTILTIPHTHLHKRNFVLVPLCEIAPNVLHPIFNKTIMQLQAECTDVSWVEK